MSSGGSTITYSATAIQVFERMSVPLTTKEKNAIAEAVDALVDEGLYSQLVELQVYGLGEVNSLLGIKGVFNGAVVATPTKVANGWQCTTVNQIQTNFANTGVLQNDGWIGAYLVENQNTAINCNLMNAVGTSDARIRQEVTQLRFAMNSNTDSVYNTETSFNNETSYTASRDNSTNQRLLKNGVIVSSPAVTSVAVFQPTVTLAPVGVVGAAWIGNGTTFNHLRMHQIIQGMLFALRLSVAVLISANSTQFYANDTTWYANNTTYYK
jgi:hypothetical protein